MSSCAGIYYFFLPSTSIKDLSSDFVRNVADLSKLFENRVTAIQTNLAKLRHLVDHCSAVRFLMMG